MRNVDDRLPYRVVVLARSASEFNRLLPIVERSIRAGRRNEVIPLHVIELPWQTPLSAGAEACANEIGAWYVSLHGATLQLERFMATKPMCLCAHDERSVLQNLNRQSPIDEVIGSGRDHDEVRDRFGLTEGYGWSGHTMTTIVAGRPSNRMLSYTVLLSADSHAARVVRLAVRLGGLRRRGRLLLAYVRSTKERHEHALHVVHRIADDAGLSLGQYAVVVERQDATERIDWFLKTSDVALVGVRQRNRLRRCLQGNMVNTILSLRSGTTVFVRGPRSRHGKIARFRSAPNEGISFQNLQRTAQSPRS